MLFYKVDGSLTSVVLILYRTCRPSPLCFVIMSEQTIPIVLIGKTAEVGSAVTELLKPEYEGL
jgi:hypothetical protein